jgi:O-glycosyl hydrolase
VAAGVTLLATGQRASAQDVTVQLDPATTHQTIDGFGVAQARFGPGLPGDDGPGDPARMLYSHPNREQVMDMTFSALNGIGATLLRVKITSALEPSLGDWRYDNDVPQAWIMKEAQARGPVKVLATAWGPPAWMKTNDSAFLGRCSNNPAKSCDQDFDSLHDGTPDDTGCGTGNTCVVGVLGFSHYQHYADYLRHFAHDYAIANGVNIFAVSLANEPEAQVPWDGCAWYGDWIAAFLDLYLRPTFSADPPVTAKVVAPEAAAWDSISATIPADALHTAAAPHPLSPTTLMGPTTDNSNALGVVDIVAGHEYNRG